MEDGHVKLFAGVSHPVLAHQISEHLDLPLGQVLLGVFPDGESRVEIKESVRGKDVFLLQSVVGTPNDYLMQLLIMADACKRGSAKSITAIIPYFGYCRQDRRDKARVPITARLVANLLERAGCTHILTMDLHSDQVQGFFDAPVDNLHACPRLLEAVKDCKLQDLVVAAADIGGSKLARDYADNLGCGIAVMDKQRKGPEDVTTQHVVGDVSGKDVLIVDDMVSTGGTLLNAIENCCQAGARRIVVAVTHGLFSQETLERIVASPIEKIIVSNTIPGTDDLEHPKVQVTSIARLFSEAIKRVISTASPGAQGSRFLE
ncbi:MAG: ribose-phosphate diphosphokinase [Chlamydiota bacterium]